MTIRQLAAAAAILIAAPATAASYIQISQPAGNQSPTSFDRFDPSQGTLQSVRITTSLAFELIGATVANGDPANAQPTGFRFQYDGMFGTALTDPIRLFADYVTEYASPGVSPFSSYFVSGSGVTEFGGAALTPFIGTGTIMESITLVSAPVVQFSTTYGNLGINFSQTGGFGQLAQRIEYVYEERALPEPASWALLIAGFGLTGTALRRRVRSAIA